MILSLHSRRYLFWFEVARPREPGSCGYRRRHWPAWTLRRAEPCARELEAEPGARAQPLDHLWSHPPRSAPCAPTSASALTGRLPLQSPHCPRRPVFAILLSNAGI